MRRVAKTIFDVLYAMSWVTQWTFFRSQRAVITELIAVSFYQLVNRPVGSARRRTPLEIFGDGMNTVAWASCAMIRVKYGDEV